MSMEHHHCRSRVISTITSVVHVSIKTALLESLMKKAWVRHLLLAGAVGSEAELRYGIDLINAAILNKPNWFTVITTSVGGF